MHSGTVHSGIVGNFGLVVGSDHIAAVVDIAAAAGDIVAAAHMHLADIEASAAVDQDR